MVGNRIQLYRCVFISIIYYFYGYPGGVSVFVGDGLRVPPVVVGSGVDVTDDVGVCVGVEVLAGEAVA